MRASRAALVGALHGTAELLPVSSSAHVRALPALLGWEDHRTDPQLRKAFEVALHAGTAAALLVALRGEVAGAALELDARRLVLLAGSFVPPAAAALLFEKPIERRLGTPRTTAAGLVAGAVAMWGADAAAQRRSGDGARHGTGGRPTGAGGRRREDAGALDALLLGLAQAAALWPGVSRNGATLAVLRARGYGRHDAGVLSRHVALPIIAGAGLLKGARLARSGLPRRERGAFAAGIAGSFASTLAFAPLVRRAERGAPLWPFAAYRLALAGALWFRR